MALLTVPPEPRQLTAALRDAIAGGPAVFPSESELSPEMRDELAEFREGVALVVETSGSTARPKRVVLRADALVASAEATANRLGGHGQWLMTLPAGYIAGAQVLVRSLVAGTEPVVAAADPASFVRASARLSTESRRYVSLVPVQLARLVEAAEHETAVRKALVSFHAILLGGQASPAALLARAEALGARVRRSYGASETAGGCVYDGVPLDGVEVRIEGGEILLSGPTLAAGYLGEPERTAEAFPNRDGRRWYRTGDVGTFRDGVLAVTGRRDDVFVSGGVKVSLGEVEQLVRGVPGWEGAVVLVAPHAEWGERAVVVAENPPVGGLADLVRAIDAVGLPPAARPVRLLAAPIPLLPSGKPDRRTLRELL